MVGPVLGLLESSVPRETWPWDLTLPRNSLMEERSRATLEDPAETLPWLRLLLLAPEDLS